MPSQDDIKHQRNLLEINRRNLTHYLQQRDTLGEAYTPPGTLNGILETRANIKRIKGILNGWGASIEDNPDDEETEQAAAERRAHDARPSPVTVNIHGGTFSGPVAQTGGSSVSNVFNQPNWKVEGNVYNIAGDMNVSATSSKDEFLAALRQFKSEIDKAQDLPADQADEMKDDVDSAIKAIDKPQPNKARAADRLTNIQKVLDGLKGSAESALALGKLIGQVLLAAQGINF
jgi:hypothetical protein